MRALALLFLSCASRRYVRVVVARRAARMRSPPRVAPPEFPLNIRSTWKSCNVRSPPRVAPPEFSAEYSLNREVGSRVMCVMYVRYSTVL